MSTYRIGEPKGQALERQTGMSYLRESRRKISRDLPGNQTIDIGTPLPREARAIWFDRAGSEIGAAL